MWLLGSAGTPRCQGLVCSGSSPSPRIIKCLHGALLEGGASSSGQGLKQTGPGAGLPPFLPLLWGKTSLGCSGPTPNISRPNHLGFPQNNENGANVETVSRKGAERRNWEQTQADHPKSLMLRMLRRSSSRPRTFRSWFRSRLRSRLRQQVSVSAGVSRLQPPKHRLTLTSLLLCSFLFWLRFGCCFIWLQMNMLNFLPQMTIRILLYVIIVFKNTHRVRTHHLLLRLQDQPCVCVWSDVYLTVFSYRRLLSHAM